MIDCMLKERKRPKAHFPSPMKKKSLSPAHPSSMFSQERRKLTNGKEGELKEEDDSGHSFSIHHGSQLSLLFGI